MSTSDLSVYNSFKMKTSVILGIAQMVMGLVIKGFNSLYFKKMIDLKHEVIPQMLLLICMFGYMDLLIIIKWNTDWVVMGESSRAPSIVN